MERLVVFDFDGTLINSPMPENGKKEWEKYYNQQFPYKGWWGRKESLDTNVFNIVAFPNVLSHLRREYSTINTSVIILTSRREKLRPEVEEILNNNNISVDDIILKKGNEGKGDVIMNIVRYNPELREIIIYDDYMDRDAEKIAEYTIIKDSLPKEIKYELLYVDNDNIRPLIGEGVISFESTSELCDLILDEIKLLNL